jgi:hypothetical protein
MWSAPQFLSVHNARKFALWLHAVQCCLRSEQFLVSPEFPVTCGTNTFTAPGIESQWSKNFLQLSKIALETIQPFPGVKRPDRGVNHPHRLASRLKKEYNYTSTPLLDLHGLFQGQLYLVCSLVPKLDQAIPFHTLNLLFQDPAYTFPSDFEGLVFSHKYNYTFRLFQNDYLFDNLLFQVFFFLKISWLFSSSFRQPWKFEGNILWMLWSPDVVLIKISNRPVKWMTNKVMHLMAIQCTLVHQEAQLVKCEVNARQQNTPFILPFFIHSFMERSVYNARHSLPSFSVKIKA